MVNVSALSSTSIGALGLGAIAVIVVLGIILSLVISALIARVLVLLVAVLLAVLVWQQRSSIEDAVRNCKTNVSFFGVHVDVPGHVHRACRAVTR